MGRRWLEETSVDLIITEQLLVHVHLLAVSETGVKDLDGAAGQQGQLMGDFGDPYGLDRVQDQRLPGRPVFAARMTNRTASGMVMEKRVTSGASQ